MTEEKMEKEVAGQIQLHICRFQHIIQQRIKLSSLMNTNFGITKLNELNG